MDAAKILHADLLDIIFEGRNKAYGAYDLRRTYRERFTRALISTGIFLLLLTLAAWLMNSKDNATDKTLFHVRDVAFSSVKYEIIPNVVKPSQSKPATAHVLVNVAAGAPMIVANTTPTAPISAVAATSGPVAAATGNNAVSSVSSGPAAPAAASAPAAPAIDPEAVFVHAQVEANFPGGADAFKRFLQNNLNADLPREHNAPPGVYTILVRFIVSRDGTISQVEATTKAGYGLEEEAIRVIRRSPAWVPAQQNGRAVNAFRVQPISFVVGED